MGKKRTVKPGGARRGGKGGGSAAAGPAPLLLRAPAGWVGVGSGGTGRADLARWHQRWGEEGRWDGMGGLGVVGVLRGQDERLRLGTCGY